LAVAGQAGAGFNPALFSSATAPAAMSTVGHVAPAISSLGSPELVSAGMGRATLVGTMSVPHSWAPAAPAASPTPTVSPAEGWYMPPGVEEASATQGTPGMPGMPMAGGAPRGWGFAAPRYGFKPTVVTRPPAAG
jgi:PPE-repeat protein